MTAAESGAGRHTQADAGASGVPELSKYGRQPANAAYCQAKVAGAQGGFCREIAVPGSDYCEAHEHHAESSAENDLVARRRAIYEWAKGDSMLLSARCAKAEAELERLLAAALTSPQEAETNA